MTTTLQKNIEWNKVIGLKSNLFIVFGVLCAVVAMKGFMIPNQFMDGGITGISILLHELYHFNISVLIISFNILFIYLGYRRIGKTFAVQTSIAVVLLAIGLALVELKPITDDKLLIAIFGGTLIGIGMGLVIRGGGVIDGAEVVAVYTTKKTNFSISEIILFFNAIIFLTAAIKFGIETAMYSLITYFTALKACDYIVDGIEEYTALTIISSEYEQIKKMLVNDFKKGISVYKGERGYLPGSYAVKHDCEIIVIIITRLELLNIKEAINEIDAAAFMYVASVKEAKGGVLKEKHGH